MKKSNLTKITTILPFDSNYIKVGKNRNKLWNLMDAEGNLVSETWFESIEKNTDGSIKTKTENEKEIKFSSVSSIKIYNSVIKFVPATVMNIVDVDSIEKCETDEYVASAYFFGQRVYITADGRIFDTNSEELRIMFNTVDTIRLNNALVKFNKKMNYNFDPDCSSNTWDATHSHHQSMFGFYWVNEDYCVFVGWKDVKIENDTKKWTDEFKIRVADYSIPKNAIEKLKELWGECKEGNKDSKNHYYTWSFTKDKLDFIIDSLENF